ncbi:MAG: hypothetical protein P8012_00595 [Desulfobacterales bacterium]
MIRPFIRIKEVFFAVRLRVLWLIPVLVNLCWAPYFLLPVKAVNAAELSENQRQKQTTAKKSQINLPDLSAEEPLIVYDGPGGALLKSKVKADFLETFNPEIDIFQNKSAEPDETSFSSSTVPNASDNRFEIIRLEQKLIGFNYGLEYRYVGKNLNHFNHYKKKAETKTKVDLKNDQEGVEIWGEKNIRSVGLKTFFARFLGNVDRDPSLPRMLTHKYGLEMKYKMDFLPVLFSFSHSREVSEDTSELGYSEYQGKQKETYNGSLKYYGGKSFNITASTSYSLSHELFTPDKETESFRHGISSSIRPASNLTITPTLSFGEYRYLWYGEQEKNPSASLSINYRKIFDVVDLSLRGRYSQTKNTDRSLDNERLNTSIGLSWTAKNLFSRKIGYSLHLGYYQYLDNIDQKNSYNSLSTSFKLEFQL